MGKTNKEKATKKQQRKLEADKAKKSQSLMGWTLGFVFVACIALIIFNAVSGSEEKTFDAALFQYEKQPSMGVKDAPVKVVEFADFKCPSCKEFEQNIFPQLKKDFIDNGTVQFYFENYPVIAPEGDSRTAAMAGEAVFSQNPEEFWKFYEAVYRQQGDERANWATSDFLVEIAKQSNLQVDYDKLKKDIDSNTFAQQVQDDEAIASKLRVTGTPTLFVNGQMVSVEDTFNYEGLKEVILKAANQDGQ